MLLTNCLTAPSHSPAAQRCPSTHQLRDHTAHQSRNYTLGRPIQQLNHNQGGPCDVVTRFSPHRPTIGPYLSKNRYQLKNALEECKLTMKMAYLPFRPQQLVNLLFFERNFVFTGFDEHSTEIPAMECRKCRIARW